MTITLNEPVIDALVARLNTDLAAQITAVNGEHSDSFTVETPAQVLDFVPPRSHLSKFPTIGVADGPSRFEDDIGGSATGRHEIMVLVFLQDEDQRGLARKLRRYSQAIVRTVLAGRNLGSGAWGTGLVSVVPGPTLGDHPENPRTFMSWTAVTIWAKKEEE
jgi:hypothetical protein